MTAELPSRKTALSPPPPPLPLTPATLLLSYQNHPHSVKNTWPNYFNILDNNGDQFLATYHSHGLDKTMLGFHEHNSTMVIGKVSPMFANQSTKSCTAINTTSGLIHWVVEGTLVFFREFEEMKKPKSRPRHLSNKLILGARSYGGSWFALTQRTTNLDMFSSVLPLEKMESMT